MAPSDLPEVVELGDMRKVYGTVVSKEDYLEHEDGKKFDSAEFEAHPERYSSSFAQKASLLMEGVGLKLVLLHRVEAVPPMLQEEA